MKKILSLLLALVLTLGLLGVAHSEGEKITAEELLKQIEELKNQYDELYGDPAEGQETEESAPDSGSDYPTLEVGSNGYAVVKLQQRLKDLGYLSGSADGSFGKGTAGALKEFQTVAGMTATGVADAQTQTALFAIFAPKNPTPVVDESAYGKLDYKGVSRDPDAYKGDKIKFSGQILQIIEMDTEVQMRVSSKGNYDDIVYAVYVIPKNYKRFLDDDKVTIYGYLDGLYSYETVRGDTITIPLCFVDRIELNE